MSLRVAVENQEMVHQGALMVAKGGQFPRQNSHRSDSFPSCLVFHHPLVHHAAGRSPAGSSEDLDLASPNNIKNDRAFPGTQVANGFLYFPNPISYMSIRLFNRHFKRRKVATTGLKKTINLTAKTAY